MRTGSRRRPQRTVQRGQSRKLVWTHLTLDSVGSPPNIQAIGVLNDFETAYGAQLVGATIERIRGLIQRGPTNTPTADTDWTGAFVVAPENAGVGSAVALDPVAAASANAGYLHWMWRGYSSFMLNGSPVLSATGNSLEFALDVRARRRLQELGDRLWFVWKATGPAAVTWETRLRLDVLVRMP